VRYAGLQRSKRVGEGMVRSGSKFGITSGLECVAYEWWVDLIPCRGMFNCESAHSPAFGSGTITLQGVLPGRYVAWRRHPTLLWLLPHRAQVSDQ
jgi:hypothetical protein